MREEGKEEEENGITGEKAAEGDGRWREDRGSAGGSARRWLRLTLRGVPRTAAQEIRTEVRGGPEGGAGSPQRRRGEARGGPVARACAGRRRGVARTGAFTILPL